MKRVIILVLALIVFGSTSGAMASPTQVGGSSSDANGDGKADVIAVAANGIFACVSTGTSFAPIASWNGSYHGFYGSIGTTAADVTGDGKTDVIAVSDRTGYYADAVFVRASNGSAFAYPTTWSESFYGTRGTAFADADGDGKADAIAVNSDRISVLISTGTRFAGQRFWTPDDFYGSLGTFFADVNGDGKADAIAVNRNGVTIRLSTGTGFAGTGIFGKHYWTPDAFYGSLGTYFTDVNGDGKADAIALNRDGITVRLSSGSLFGNGQLWLHTAYYGTRGTFFADVSGDGKADAIAVNDHSTSVRLSNGSSFTQGHTWGTGPCYGNVATTAN
jgi:FG-GAP-like repeat